MGDAVLDAQGPQLGDEALLEHRLELLGQEAAGSLHGLEKNISRVAVGHDHVHLAVDRLPGLHIARKIDAALVPRLFEELVGLPLQVSALGRLRADVQQPHPRLRAAHDMFCVIGAHKSELEQIFRRTLGGGAAVDEDRASLARGDHGRHGRPADALDALYQERRRGQEGPCAAR